MIKKVLMSVSIIMLIVLSSCKNFYNGVSSEVSFTIGEDLAGKINEKTAQSSEITCTSIYDITF